MKRYVKMLALVVAFVMILGIGLFANGLLGNPISKMLATNTAKEYIEAQYGDADYYIERISYSFKDTSYHAYIVSPSSVDTEFTLYVSMLGKLQRDTIPRDFSDYCRYYFDFI